MNASLTIPFLTLLIILWTSGNAVFNTIFSPGQWYLTPGLWEKQGGEFLLAFLLETPFVALREGLPILLIAAGLVMLGVAAYQSILYRQARKNFKAA